MARDTGVATRLQRQAADDTVSTSSSRLTSRSTAGLARQRSRRQRALIIGFGVVLAAFVFWSIVASFHPTTGGVSVQQAPWDAGVRLAVQAVRTVYAFMSGRSTNEDLFP